MRFLPFLLSLVTLAVSLPLEIRDNIPMPQDDPFYTPPAGYESAKVGDILASRSVKIAAFSKLPQNLKAAYQLLYRTVDINGNPAATVQTVMVPYNARKGPMRILSYQAAEDSVSLHCAPSYQFQLDTVGDNGSMQLEIINIDHALGSGYITLVPDYEGLSSAFGVGPLAATGVLDGIRAALNFQTVIPNKTDTQLAMLGYSGGGLATAWASQLASTYAPELTFVGVAEGGVPVNLESSIDLVNKGQNAGEIASALVGVSQVYPEVQQYIADHLYPNGNEAFAAVKDQCIGKDLTEFQFQDIFSYFNVTEDEFKAAEPIRKVFNATLLGQPGSPLPQMPLYIYHSVNDEIVNGADEDDYVNNLCARGIKSLHSERELVGGHISLAVTGDAQAFNFLEDRFNGKPPVPGCTIVNTTTSLADPLNAVVFGATLLDFLKGLLGLPIAYLGPA